MSAPASIARENSTVLIVYEEIGEGNGWRDVVEEAGFRTFPVSDAPSALRIIHREGCDLVVLDLEISGVAGLALCRLLRAQPTTSQLLVIALSDRHSEDSTVAA